MNLIPPLCPGDIIGICAPSSFVTPDDVAEGIAALTAKGFQVRVHPQTFARWNQSAGTHDEKISALHDLFSSPEIKAVWAAGGGNRALHLLDRIDWRMIRNNPKPYIGFSDSTALVNAVFARTGFPALHGPLLKRVRTGPELDHLLDLMSGKTTSLPMSDAEIFRPGTAQGPLIGGEVSLIQCLTGTRDMPDAKGCILFLEEVGEETSRIDRAFAQISRAGLFKNISGIILGNFSDLKDTGRPFGFTLRDIISEHLDGYDIPILLNAPFGHTGPFYALPVGGWGEIIAKKGTQPSVTCRLNRPDSR